MNHSFPKEAALAREPKFTVREKNIPLNVLGDTQYVLLTGEDTQGRFALIENENPPGVGPPLHVHRNEDEAFYVLDGEVEFTAKGESVVCGPGETVSLPEGLPHTWKTVGETNARMLIMLFPAGLETYFRTLSELSEDGPPDMEKVLEVSAQHGIEFPEIDRES